MVISERNSQEETKGSHFIRLTQLWRRWKLRSVLVCWTSNASFRVQRRRRGGEGEEDQKQEEERRGRGEGKWERGGRKREKHTHERSGTEHSRRSLSCGRWHVYFSLQKFISQESWDRTRRMKATWGICKEQEKQLSDRTHITRVFLKLF